MQAAVSGQIPMNPFGAMRILEQYKDDIEPAKYVQLGNAIENRILAAEKKLERKQKEQEAMSKVIGGLQGIYAVDPYDPSIKAAANKIYRAAKEGKININPIDMVQKLNFLPNDAKTELQGYLVNGNPEQQLESSRELLEYMRLRPNLVEGFSEREKAKAFLLTQQVDIGVPLNKAIAYANQAAFQTDEAKIKERKEKLVDGQGTSLIRNISGIQGGWMTPKIAVPEELNFEYKKRIENYVLFGGMTLR